MRIGLTPESSADHVALTRQTYPVPVMESSCAMMLARVVMAGVRLGVFAALSDGPMRAPELAEKIGCDPEGVGALCDALIGCGYLARRGDRYAVTPLAKHWLLPRSPQSVADFVECNYDLWSLWSHLEDIVRSGKSADDVMDDPGQWHRYVRGLRVLATLNADVLSASLSLRRDAAALLDIGGGPGFNSVNLCRRYPNLQATVVDADRAAAIGRTLVQEQGLAGRIAYRVADPRCDDLGRNEYDVVLLFNVIHRFDSETNRRLCERVWGALKPGGLFAIGDVFKVTARSPTEQYDLLIGLQVFLRNRRDAYPLELAQAWMSGAGFYALRTVRLAAGTQMLMGRKRETAGRR